MSRFARQKKYILTLVLSEKKILNETKKHNPPFKLNGRSLRWTLSIISLLPKPHISHPYSRIGFTILSKRS